MAPVRPAILAGSWYPADPDELASQVDGWLATPPTQASPPLGRPRIALAPHAGFAYSGATAGLAHAALLCRHPRRVVVMAPNHRAPLDRIALSSAGAFATPLGLVPVDREAVRRLTASPAFVVDDAAHTSEHAVEIQLPFLQRPDPAATPSIVPLLVPALPENLVRHAADDLATLLNDDTVLLVSTDFTHYGASYGFVPFREDIPAALERLDAGAILRILAGDGPGLRAYGRETGITMCGLEATALALEIDFGPAHESALLGYERSADRDGDFSHSVSYAAVVLSTAVENDP